jgi:hypothetical protein
MLLSVICVAIDSLSPPGSSPVRYAFKVTLVLVQGSVSLPDEKLEGSVFLAP